MSLPTTISFEFEIYCTTQFRMILRCAASKGDHFACMFCMTLDRCKPNLTQACSSRYSRPQDVSRNRSNFFHGQYNTDSEIEELTRNMTSLSDVTGRVATLITTERFYFYKRYRFRGAQHVSSCLEPNPMCNSVHHR